MSRMTTRLRTAALVVLSGAVLAACAPAPPPGDEPIVLSLFDGESLEGWVQRGGEALYSVEDGTIVGRTVLDTPNSFLCTERDYDNFLLEFEVKVDPALNSGVQIRSHSTPDYKDGRVHGYQVEIDPTDRGYSGGIYDEARRKWLDSPDGDEEAMAAFKPGEWNQYEIEAVGDRIRTFVNGVPVANLVDAMDQSGFIGLQVHSAKEAGLEVRWRNIKLQEQFGVVTGREPNTLTEEERADGWRLLWDGNTSWGWRGANAETFPEEGWEIQDGVLSVLASGGGESRAGGDIITVDNYSNFELSLEYRITEVANSGIKYFVDTDLLKGEGSAIGLEFQILDDENHPDAEAGKDGNRKMASLYDLIPAPDDKEMAPVGEWNAARIVSQGSHVEHWLNGKKVVEYERGSPEYRELVAESKYKIWKDFGERPEGPILLQEHGSTVSFRNIKIRQLDPS
jgi:hypothetical protein